MKRLLPALLTAAICLSLAACAAQKPAPAGTPAPAPVPTAEPAPEPTPFVVPEHPTSAEVFTDWSGLTAPAAPAEICTRLSPAPMETLRPGGYGLLLPYEGVKRFAEGEYGWELGGLWGLVTREGQIVLDPVCSEIRRVQRYTETEGAVYGNLYVLTKLVYLPDSPQANEYNEGWLERCAVCAADGSWSTDFVYEEVYGSPMGALCIRSGGGNLAEWRDENGRVLFDTADWAVRDRLNEWAVANLTGLEAAGWAPVYLRSGYYAYVNVRGEVLKASDAYRFSDAQAFSEGLAAVRVGEKWGFLDERGRMAIEPQYDDVSYGGFIGGQVVVYVDGRSRSLLIDREGKVLLEAETIGREARYGNVWYHAFSQKGDDRWYDAALRLIEYDGRSPDGCWIELGFFFREEGGIRVLTFDGGERFYPNARDFSAYENGCVVYEESECRVYDAAGELALTTESDRWPFFRTDSVTGETYIYVNNGVSGCDVYTTAGEYLLCTDAWDGPADGLFLCSDNLTTGYKNAAGEWVFRVRVDQED